MFFVRHFLLLCRHFYSIRQFQRNRPHIRLSQQLYWQPDGKESPCFAIRTLLSPDAPAMRFDKTTANCQAQTNTATATFTPAINLIEAIKDRLGQMRRNAGAIIGKRDRKSVV